MIISREKLKRPESYQEYFDPGEQGILPKNSAIKFALLQDSGTDLSHNVRKNRYRKDPIITCQNNVGILNNLVKYIAQYLIKHGSSACALSFRFNWYYTPCISAQCSVPYPWRAHTNRRRHETHTRGLHQAFSRPRASACTAMLPLLSIYDILSNIMTIWLTLHHHSESYNLFVREKLCVETCVSTYFKVIVTLLSIIAQSPFFLIVHHTIKYSFLSLYMFII